MHNPYNVFLTVLDCETISRAAQVLHTTQPTISRQIQQLERDLGVLLFDRVGKRLVLTRAGSRVAVHARQMHATNMRLLEELNAFTDPERGVIRVGAGLTPTIYRLPQIIAEYRVEHPHVQFQIRTGSSNQTLENLRQRDIDIAIVTTAPIDQLDLRTIPLWQDELHVVVDPAHALAGKTVSIRRIVQENMVMMPIESSLRTIVETRIRPYLDEDVFQPVIETDSLEAISRFVQARQGIALLPTSAVVDDIAAGRLANVFPSDVQFGSRTVTAVTRFDSSVSRATDLFLATLSERGATADLSSV